MEKKSMKRFLLILLLTALAISACTAEPGQSSPQDSDSLLGAWTLTSYGPANAPVPAVEGVEAGLTFNKDGTVSGTSGCNGLGGDYSVEGDKITFGEFVSTLIACDDPIMRQEDATHKVMSGTATYRIDGDTLTITNNATVLVFTRGMPSTEPPSEPESLIGIWKLTAYGPANAPTPAVEGVDAGLTFSKDGTVSGSSGCNGLGGDYTVEGDQITFGEFVSTLMACDDPIMRQEEFAHKIMTGTATYTIEGDRLTITKDSDLLVLTRREESTELLEGSDLLGGWKLVSYGTTETQSPALADVEAGLTFNEDGTVVGTSGCNEFGGNYSVDGNEIAFKEMVSTLMLCDTPIMEQEEAMSQMLSDLTASSI
jgi:heat shock protein HslJ